MGESGARGRSVLLLACGALAQELLALKRLGGWDHVSIECLPAQLHNTPREIPDAVRAKLEEVKDRYDEVFVAYADCGTGGRLDVLLDEYGMNDFRGRTATNSSRAPSASRRSMKRNSGRSS